MKILYDHQAFTGKRYGGISRYFFELMNYYNSSNLLDFELAVKFSNNAYIEKVPFSNHHTYPHIIGYKNTNRLVSYINRQSSKKTIEAGKFDIFHPTFYHSYFLNNLNNKPFVLTFHDCTSEKFHHLYPSLGGDAHSLKQQLLDKAARVIAISQSTKDDLLHYFQVDESKVDVIYHCTSFSEYVEDDTSKISVPENYLLFVGDRLDYKNFNFFIKSLSPLLKKEKDLYVVCAGGRPFSKEENNYLSDLGIADKVKYHEIYNDHTLKNLYKNAIAFAFPSLNEGFGLPILEAFACKCPVLVSNTSCFPEIAGEAAEYFNPTDSESILHSVERVVGNEPLRKKMINEGSQRIQYFTKEKMALQTFECYKSSLDSL